MALSWTLEPDPGHAGVGTEQDAAGISLRLRFAWISIAVWRSLRNVCSAALTSLSFH
jgi:hypothetical protein